MSTFTLIYLIFAIFNFVAVITAIVVAAVTTPKEKRTLMFDWRALTLCTLALTATSLVGTVVLVLVFVLNIIYTKVIKEMENTEL